MAGPDLLLARRLFLNIGAGFLLALMLMTALSVIGLREMAGINTRLENIVHQNNVKTRLANQIRDILRDRAISMLSIVVMNDPFQRDAEMLRFYEFGGTYQETRQKLQALPSLPAEVAVLARIDALTRTNRPVMVQVVDLGMEGYTFLAFEILQQRGIPMQQELVKELDNLIAIQLANTQDAAQQARAAYDNTRWLMLALGVAAAAVSILVALLVMRRTGRLTAETERERTKFQTLFESNPDGIVLLDEHGFTECNPATLEMFRIPSEAAFLALRPEDLGEARQADGRSAWEVAAGMIRQAVDEGHTHTLWQGRRADGSVFPCEIALHAIRLDGTPYIQAILRDITTQKEAEAALQTAHDAAVTTAELKSQFLANVSHEVRTPMNGIIGMTRLLLSSPLDPRQREHAEAVSRSAKSLLAIINDLLDFSKIEAGRLSLEEIPFDLDALLKDVLELSAPRATTKGLQLQLDRAGVAQAWRSGDPLRLRQILLNLLDNAVKFTEQGQVCLSVEPISVDGREGLRFTVLDTGIGIPPEAHERIFEAFAQADGSTSRRFGGTGLGLSICRQLAELMGGRLGLESTPGQGSTFRLDVPLPATEPPAEAKAPDLPLPRFAGTRVLVAEDNPVNLKLAHFMLEGMEVEAISARDGREAFEKRQSEAPDLILMDCQMPVWDGLMATRAIRDWEAQHRRPRTPIVALTANAAAGFAERCLQTGMDACLVKPIDDRELARTLARWLPDRVSGEPQVGRVRRGLLRRNPTMATQRDGNAPPFDLDRLLANCRQDVAKTREILELFLHSSAEILTALGAAILAHDDAQAARQAHQLKGAAAYVGAAETVRLSAATESAAKTGDWERLDTCASDLEANFIRVRAAMEQALRDRLGD